MPLRPITDVAQDLGFSPADIETYGNDKAKIPLQSFPTRRTPASSSWLRRSLLRLQVKANRQPRLG